MIKPIGLYTKYILKNGYEIINAVKAPRRIVTIRKDTYYYGIADIQSHRTEIQAGIKALLLEERSEWAKVSLVNGEFWMKMEDLSPNDVNIEMKRYISEMGTGTITASSFYSGSLGQERLHSPDKAFDGNIKTAWIEGNDNNGVVNPDLV
ncbi:MAG: discoidin domain-containing protein [Microcoleus sp. SM1_3_4]|nr:discoidin domain-containing protein [Microcoleus sp. SM1_3_4]